MASSETAAGSYGVGKWLQPNVRPPKTTWWAKIRTPRGKTGWVIATNNFDGQDMLAEARPSDVTTRLLVVNALRPHHPLAVLPRAESPILEDACRSNVLLTTESRPPGFARQSQWL